MCFQRFYMNLWGWRSGAILTTSHHSLQKAFLDLFGENPPAFAPRIDWEDSEHGDSFPFFVRKDWRGLPFIFHDKEWKEWGGFSSAPSKDAEDSSTTGVLGGFSCIPSREKKVAEGVMLLVSHLSRATMPWRHWEDSLLPSS